MNINSTERNGFNFHSKQIIKLSIELYWDYKKSFIITQIIGFAGSIFALILSFIIGGSVIELFKQEDITGFMITFLNVLSLSLVLPGLIILFSFMGSLYGMSKEIILSGDYYVNLKSSFLYFRKHWIAYSLTGFLYVIGIVGINSILPDQMESIPSISKFSFLFLLTSILDLFWSICLTLFVSSISTSSSFKESVKLWVSTIRKNFLFTCKTYALFMIPFYILSYLWSVPVNNITYSNLGSFFLFILFILYIIVVIFFQFPVLAILSQIFVSQSFSIDSKK